MKLDHDQHDVGPAEVAWCGVVTSIVGSDLNGMSMLLPENDQNSYNTYPGRRLPILAQTFDA